MPNRPESLSHPSLYLREEEIRLGIELLYFAYRDFTEAPDALLAKEGFGRAHHRVLYFVRRNPDTTVSGLLDLLKITKQSLSRVLNQLVDSGYIQIKQGIEDRRQRLLRLTDKGVEFEESLFQLQKEHMAQAYRTAGVDSVNGFRDVLFNIMDEKSRSMILKRAK